MTGETQLCSMHLILQLASTGTFSWRGPREKVSTNTQGLSRPMFKAGTPSFPLHSTGQSNSQEHSRSKGWGKKDYVLLVRIIKLYGEGRGWDGVSGPLKNQSIAHGVSITFPFNSCCLVQKGCWYVDSI